MDLTAAPYGGARYPIEARMDERIFARFHLDAGIATWFMQPLNNRMPGLAGFAASNVAGPDDRFASSSSPERFHAYTLPRERCE